MDIIIAADLVPTKSNIHLFNTADIEELLGNELRTIWEKADIKLFNLEVPLTNVQKPIDKFGPHLYAPISTIKGIKELNPNLIVLANNHIMDQDYQGLTSTIQTLTNNNIPFIGAGENLNQASIPYIIEKNGIKVGIYACAENEFSIATQKNPGANPFDPFDSLDHIYSLSKKCDYLIVLYHGGKEHYRYPTPYQRKACRKMVEKGADLVICQHSHAIGCYEEYKDSTIVYGQGNFIFDGSNLDYWKTSLLVNVTIDLNKNVSVNYIPIYKKGNVVRLAKEQQKKEIMNGFIERSNELLIDGFVENKFNEYSKKVVHSYLRNIFGFKRWMNYTDKKLLKGLLLKRKISKQHLLKLQNYIMCETHREVILTGIKGDKPNVR